MALSTLRRYYLRWEPDAVTPPVRICGGGRERSRFLLRPSGSEYSLEAPGCEWVGPTSRPAAPRAPSSHRPSTRLARESRSSAARGSPTASEQDVIAAGQLADDDAGGVGGDRGEDR